MLISARFSAETVKHPEHQKLLQLIGGLVERHPQHAGSGSRQLRYFIKAEAKAPTTTQIAAQSPSDRSEIRSKDVMSGQLSAVRFSNGSAGSPKRRAIGFCFPPVFPRSGVHEIR
jgi:hypothetical protein